ncbi:hypothetical protein A3860_11895 [Niastella vici]|uniref:Glucose/Sorbosone dehydrogenase domain-containing protein n=1 Tax=Niastella vici TaxID=1703345 RepID=A0A1V9FG57_9BACT|nr:hypothetical protein [Niastella vici]OQP57251.1 hypothetical protein A3860_11895 [Niastella vici]
MKRRFLFMLLVMTIAAVAASAQQQDPVMTRPQLLPLPKLAPVKLPIRPTTGLGCSPINDDWYREGTLLGTNSAGKVYGMPVDNMLCLVPDGAKTTRMPVKRTTLPEPMPNAFSGRVIQGRR